jgi:predicted transcriptional regulator
LIFLFLLERGRSRETKPSGQQEKIMSELFPIVIDVEDGRVGSVLRQLDAMPGIVNIHLQIGKRRNTPKQRVFPQTQPATAANSVTVALEKRTERRQELATMTAAAGATSVKEVIANALGHGSIHRNILARILVKSGFSPVTVNSTLSKMSADKVIKRVGPGTYRLTKLGIKKYLETPVPRLFRTGERSKDGVNPNQKGLRAHILKSLSRKAKDHKELKNVITDGGFVSNNIHVLVPKMIKEGLINKTNDTYEITAKGSKALAGESYVDSNSDAPVIEYVGYTVHGDSA